MPTRFSVIHTNHVDSSTLSVSPSGAAGFPIANLKTRRRTQTFRTSGVTAQQLRASWPTNQSINAVALCHHNLGAAATWRIRLYSDDAFTTLIAGTDTAFVTAYDSAGIGALDSIDSPTFREYKNSVHWYGSTFTNVRSMTIDLTDTGNADGFLSAARLFAGPYLELSKNFKWGHPVTPVSPTKSDRTVGGDKFSIDSGPTTRQIDLDLSGVLIESDRNFIFDLIRVKGRSGDFFLSCWPNQGGKITRDYAMWGSFSAWRGLDRGSLNYYGTTATVESN
jgi:hypothetical protein